MKPRQHVLVLIWLSMLLGCSPNRETVHPAVAYDTAEASNRIASVLPNGWMLASAPPLQHFWTTNLFPHVQTHQMMLLGPKPNYWEWESHDGKTHRENIAKECLYIWIIPNYARPVPYGPGWNEHLPKTVFLASNLCVYADINQEQTISSNRYREIMADMHSGRVPDVEPSWTNWQHDIENALQR